MKTKTFIVAGLVGGLVNWFLGWLSYGVIFIEHFKHPKDDINSIIYVFFSYLSIGFFLSYFYNQWAHISTATKGAKAGAIFGIFLALFCGFFNLAMQNITSELFIINLVVSILMTAITGAVVGAINGKM